MLYCAMKTNRSLGASWASNGTVVAMSATTSPFSFVFVFSKVVAMFCCFCVPNTSATFLATNSSINFAISFMLASYSQRILQWRELLLETHSLFHRVFLALQYQSTFAYSHRICRASCYHHCLSYTMHNS